MMDDKLKIIFVGGLTNGKIVFDYLLKNKFVDIKLVVTYPDNYSGARHVPFPNSDYTIKSCTLKGCESMISEIKPDYIIVVGWSELIPVTILHAALKGVIGFHPSKLPCDRGRSVIAWQIEDGYKEIALTMFKYNDFPDGGDILAQEAILIENNDYINDVLDKVDHATKNLIHAYFPLLRKGLVQVRSQDLSTGTFRRLRNDDDLKIDWNKNSQVIYNKIRAVSHPYPGAIAVLGEELYRVWKSEIVIDFAFGREESPGTLVAIICDESYIVKTKDAFLRITSFSKL